VGDRHHGEEVLDRTVLEPLAPGLDRVMNGLESELAGERPKVLEVGVGLDVGVEDLASRRVDAERRPGLVDLLGELPRLRGDREDGALYRDPGSDAPCVVERPGAERGVSDRPVCNASEA
jgi:hypothetical protein